MSTPFKILLKYPSRGRPGKFFRGLDSIYNNLADKVNFHVSCTLDLDDESMCNQEVIDRITAYGNISIAWGKSDSKIHAINRDMPDVNGYDIIICMSDDQIFTLYGFDDIIRIDMNAVFPEFDGLLHYLDKDTQGALATLYVAGVNFYKRRGHIYHPSYFSLWADNEIQEVAILEEKYHFIGTIIYWHANPAYYPEEGRDEKFDHDQSLWDIDEANYNKRKLINFELP
jgi:hypothetical protein